MAFLESKQLEELKGVFTGLVEPVEIVMFTQEFECQHCKMTREMLEEIGNLSDKITVTIKDLVTDAEEAKRYGVDKVPAILILGDKDYGIRFYGVPAGYEFTPLINDIINISKRDHGISDEIMAELNKVDKPVHLQIMISTTCPYCPPAVSTAHAFAMANENITADMVETSEFPHLVNRYNVNGVPHTVINEKESVVGAVPQKELVQKILNVIK